MKINKMNRWSSLFALIAAGIIIQTSPSVFAQLVVSGSTIQPTQINQIWADLGVQGISQFNKLITTPVQPTAVQTAVQKAVASYPTLGGTSGLFPDANWYSQAMVAVVLSACKAPAKYNQYTVQGALIGIELLSGTANTSGSISSVIAASTTATPALTDKQLAAIGTVVGTALGSSGTAAHPSQVPVLAYALSVPTVVKDLPKLATAMAAVSGSLTGVDAPMVANQISISAKGDAKILAAIAKDFVISTAISPTIAPQIANAVALTSGTVLATEVLIAKTVAGIKTVTDPGAVVTLVEQTSLTETGTNYATNEAGYVLKATNYANVAASYAAAVSKQAATAAGYAASQTVAGMANTASVATNGTTGINYYNVALTFGGIMKANTNKAMNVKNIGALATGLGTELEEMIDPSGSNPGAAAKPGSGNNTVAYNLTEVMGAVGVAFVNNLKVTDVKNASAVLTALVTIQPICATDLLGLVLTDLNARSGKNVLTFTTAAAMKTTADKLTNAVLQAIANSLNNASPTAMANTQAAVNALINTLFVKNSKGVLTFVPANSPYHLVGNNLTGAETPINNL